MTSLDVYNAVDRILQGVRRSGLDKELPVLRRLACHEMGHALVATLLRERTGNIEKVERVSIEVRYPIGARTGVVAARRGSIDGS